MDCAGHVADGQRNDQLGRVAARAPLPSESYLQQEQGVSRGTVRMAVGILREEGLEVTTGGQERSSVRSARRRSNGWLFL